MEQINTLRTISFLATLALFALVKTAALLF